MGGDLDQTIVLERNQGPRASPSPNNAWGRLLAVNSGQFPNITLSEDSVWLGRSKELDAAYRLPSKLISNKHVRFVREGDAVFIEDHSTNGTFVNGVALQKGVKTPLANHSEVCLVDMTRVDAPDAPAFYFTDLRLLAAPSAAATATSAPATAASPGSPVAPPTKRSLSPDPSGGAPSSAAKVAKSDDDAMLENLICHICHEILYKPVSLVPCLHTFCGSCYSTWMARSSDCPSCRSPTDRVGVNHVLNNLVEAFLKAHPERDRDPEEKAEMDKSNKVTDKLMNVRRRRYNDDSDDSDGSASNDSGDSDDDQVARCSECDTPDGAGFRCSPTARHVNCRACFRMMVDRSDEPGVQQKCDICDQFFCQFYKGNCGSANASSRFVKLSEHKFDQLPMVWPGCFRGNTHERSILQSYLVDNGIPATDCYLECIRKFLDGEFNVGANAAAGTGGNRLPAVDRAALRMDSNACSDCATRLFCELVYDYRKAIPNDRLPASVTSRANCWYGRNCNTQFNPTNPSHRQRLNHVCEQTR